MEEIPFHGGNRGSNPLGDANLFNKLDQKTSVAEQLTPGDARSGTKVETGVRWADLRITRLFGNQAGTSLRILSDLQTVQSKLLATFNLSSARASATDSARSAPDSTAARGTFTRMTPSHAKVPTTRLSIGAGK